MVQILLALKTLLDKRQLHITLQRLAHQLTENDFDLSRTVIIGIQPRGIHLSERIVNLVREITRSSKLLYGKLDITFYRDDVHQRSGMHLPASTDIGFSIAEKTVILVDDVLHTGRTIRSAMDALIDFGRPKQVELLVLIDRHFSRELPIQPDYVGQTIDTVMSQKVKVYWEETDGRDEVVLID